MGQPTAPPLSIRLGDVRLAKIDAYAVKQGLKRHAAILELIDVALEGRVWVAGQRPTPKPVPGSDAAKRKAEAAQPAREPSRAPAAKVDIQIGPVARKPGDLMKKGKK